MTITRTRKSSWSVRPPASIEDAINNALAEANKSIKHLEWFEVTETRGHIKDGKAAHFQVTLKVGFRIASS